VIEVKLIRRKQDNRPLILVKQGNQVIFLTKTIWLELKQKVEQVLPEYEQRKLDWYENKQRALEYYKSVVKGE
jgi:hypothetical protein